VDLNLPQLDLKSGRPRNLTVPLVNGQGFVGLTLHLVRRQL
jgi:hypothetical protein